jgi:hypothetical protein
MKKQELLAIGAATFAWGLFVIVPALVLWTFPVSGLQAERVAFFGFILGAIVWFQTVFSADASNRYGMSDFSFLLSCVAMGAFVTLIGSSILSAPSDVPESSGAFVLTGLNRLHFAGMLASLIAAVVAARTLKSSDEPSPAFRLLSMTLSAGLLAFYVVLLMASGST